MLEQFLFLLWFRAYNYWIVINTSYIFTIFATTCCRIPNIIFFVHTMFFWILIFTPTLTVIPVLIRVFLLSNLHLYLCGKCWFVLLMFLMCLFLLSLGVILEIEGSIRQRYEMVFFPIKIIKCTSNLSNLYVHSIFTLLLIKQIFEKKSFSAATKSWMQFWPRIAPVSY